MYYLGIDLGGTSIKAGVCNEKGKIIYKESCPTVTTEDGDRIINDMAELCKRVIKQSGLKTEVIEYAGIASPGTADSEHGEIVYACTLPFLNYPISKKLSELTGIKKVYVENDANAAAKGEAIVGAAQGYTNSVMITLGTGVGGGIIIDNKVYAGFNFAGAELGHIVIIYNGKQCTCGRKGCWEAYASATALIEQTKQKMLNDKNTLMWKFADGNIEKVGGKTAFAAMKQGDTAAKEVVDTYISYLACGIVNIINIFQPEVLSIGGGISNEREFLTEPLIEIVKKEQYSRNSPKQTIIKIAQLGNDAGIIGAAMLGR
ncbi:MAG: glucokinase [Clostridiales bacterium GWF2_36_10]|nr:MAG: glucokinase [Clostridiales bacterium GWF2_36_10]HAN20946.1 glucokinase [Clostridiales bacterium]